MKRHLWSLIASILFAGVLASSTAFAADEASRYYEDALVRYERKDDAGAIIQLKNALKADPGLLAAHLLMGRAALRKGDYAAAEVALREAQRRGVSRAEYVLALGNLLLATGRQRELLESIQPTELPAGLKYDVLLLRAQAHTEMAQYALALAAVKDAQTLNPSASPALAQHARILLEAGRADEAATLAEQATTANASDADAWATRASVAYATGKLPAALAHYERAISLKPEHVDALLGRSSVLMDTGRMADARATLLVLSKAEVKEPRASYLLAVIADISGDRNAAQALLGEVVGLIDPLPRSVLTSRSHLALIAGLSHLGLGGKVKAKEYLQLHTRFFPSQLAARKPLASLQVEEGDAASAILTLEPVMRSGTRDPEVLTLVASAYSKLKRHDRATELLEEASRLGASPEVQTSLGLNLLGSKQTELGVAKLQDVLRKDPAQARASTALALHALRERQPRQAVELMEVVTRREPDNLPALNVLGVARAAAGDFAGARKAYEMALAGDKTFDSVKLNLARLDVAEGKPDQARARLDALLKENPDHSSALYERAMLDTKQGRLEQAQRGFETLREKNKKHVGGHVALIDLYVQMGALDKALELAKDSTSSQPGYLAVQAALARVQLAKGDQSGARSTLNSMTRVADFDPVAQYKIARMQLQAGNPSGAAYSVEKALQGDPGFMPAKIMQAELLLAEGAIDRADGLAQALLKGQAATPDAFKLAGDIAFLRGQWPAAISHYRNALSRGADAELAGRLYQAHVRSGNKTQARASIEELVRKHPHDNAMKLLLSQVQIEAGQLREAKATLETVLKAGESAPVLNNLANVQWQLKDPRALQTAERAFKLAPGEPVVLDTLGWMLVQQGQMDAGLQHLREARLRDPANPEIRYHLGWALAKSGRSAEARQELDAALQPGVAFPGAEAAQILRAELK
ncbi:PEP-CTERM system TPR-repeat protein PrsT [Methyloversatilis sp. XJ19-13]|uniref:XrtA/PEP-CTERM system TPR-repeat protein PrsT n=1 Tax=Methyloversatilis sp. XJ19-13 TaxID=2963430 RepID=UPI00211B9A67|nr:XrtA/PEP-CTERM system TPR-repeat protein PrsT [Methyloversatilis sp. XJ19-13]MCQ9374463.1 PEP-CTERM system TPR-repeat protein PrsT [Methyloversatilis sp. XJ19-13]